DARWNAGVNLRDEPDAAAIVEDFDGIAILYAAMRCVGGMDLKASGVGWLHLLVGIEVGEGGVHVVVRLARQVIGRGGAIDVTPRFFGGLEGRKRVESLLGERGGEELTLTGGRAEAAVGEGLEGRLRFAGPAETHTVLAA